MLKPGRIAEICSRFAGKKILVYGDVILDRYIFGHVERISPEAPVPVVTVELEESRLGGAGNVAANIDRLGAGGLLLGVTGRDGFAGEIARLKKKGNLVVRAAGNRTIVKTRIISQRQQIVRVDREGVIRLDAALLGRIRAAIVACACDGIIVSDYGKGTVNAEVMALLKARAAAAGIPIVVDPKPPHFDLYCGVTGITPNLKEAEQMAAMDIHGDAAVARALNRIRRKYRTRFTLVTRGSQGISAAEKNRRLFHLPAFSREVFDVTGAGDTVVAVLTLALAVGADLREAVALANAAASIVVEKVGTSQVGLEELQDRLAFILSQR
ncbi:MAG: PfkB family carbohydrate kinase [Acidobacteria bacterium]|jgi:D-beta-D-heptose 7-phosphate kinase/D-beta-D-heptose 1-phosphate adenosyltransferase|nr:PfkB family carbohydrate kinase [Acidobacteriota bacterium]